MMSVSNPTSDRHFCPHDILLLRPCYPLVTVSLGIHNMLLQKLIHITPVLPLPYSCFCQLEIYLPIHPIVPMNFMRCQLLLAGCTANFIVLILFSASAGTFITNRSLYFLLLLVFVGILGGI